MLGTIKDTEKKRRFREGIESLKLSWSVWLLLAVLKKNRTNTRWLLLAAPVVKGLSYCLMN